MKKTARFFSVLLFGITLFAGLPLLGWGIMDPAGFVSHPVRLGFLIAVAVMQAYFAFRHPDLGRNHGVGPVVIARQGPVLILMQIFVIAAIVAAPWSDRHATGTFGCAGTGCDMALRSVGLVVFALGYIVMNQAEVALGRLFSVQVTIQEGHRLVTDGVFRHIRHPRYSSIIVYNLGLVLLFRSWLALIPTVCLLLVMLWRIHDEEALLAKTFGAEWEAYARRSWRLMVGLW